MAAEGKDQVGPSPEQVSGWKPGSQWDQRHQAGLLDQAEREKAER